MSRPPEMSRRDLLGTIGKGAVVLGAGALVVVGRTVAIHAHRPHNLERDVLFELGDVAAAFASADLVREGT